LSNGTRLALAGVASGAMLAMWSSEVIEGMLFQVGPSDPLTFIAAASILTAVALVASYGPAHRASRIDPVVALREQ
jgi:putative ABC transport system permease protein